MCEMLKELLPMEYQGSVISAVSFEKHHEPSLRADKVIGYDVNEKKCFYYHTFTLTEECFDIDEFPILIDVYYERVIAWRITGGQWVRIKSYSDQLDHFNTHFTHLAPEITTCMPR